jgi:hypothetical protein
MSNTIPGFILVVCCSLAAMPWLVQPMPAEGVLKRAGDKGNVHIVGAHDVPLAAGTIIASRDTP